MAPVIEAVSADDGHRFSKQPRERITLIAGLGVEGDAHAGATVQHLSRVKRDATAANLRQVHLVHAELLDELTAAGFTVGAGALGENVLTRGVDLLALPTGTRLRLGSDAVVEVAGLRNPCRQLDQYERGLMAAVLERDEEGRLVRKAGVMAVVVAGGVVAVRDAVAIELPAGVRRPLEPV
jgi:MOSC domain-containing protein YiiM